MADVRPDQLRQGPTGSDHAGRPRRLPRPLPGRGRGHRVISQQHDLREISNSVLEASGAEHTEVIVTDRDTALTRFANSEIHQNVSERDIGVRIRVVNDHRVGVASTNPRAPPYRRWRRRPRWHRSPSTRPRRTPHPRIAPSWWAPSVPSPTGVA